MKALMELNRDDIRDIIALHFGVDESAVTVSRRATVRVSGDVPVKNTVKTTEGGPRDDCGAAGGRSGGEAARTGGDAGGAEEAREPRGKTVRKA